MKRRFVETRKILAVALGAAAAGCSAAPSSEGAPVAVAPVTTGAPVPAQPEPAAARPPAPDPLPSPIAESPPHSNDPALLALRDELARQPRGKLQDPDHYRPLCDKDGFPLVGNVMRKTVKQDYQPSQLCAELRTQAKR